MNLKRMFQGLAIGAAFLLPFSASAMSPITDSELSAVTGQAGVSINLDARVDLMANVVAWGDADGFVAENAPTNTGGAGWVGLTGLNIQNLRIRADQGLLDTAYANIGAAAGAKLDADVLAVIVGSYTTKATAYQDAFGALLLKYNTAHSTTYDAFDFNRPGIQAQILADTANCGAEITAFGTAKGNYDSFKTTDAAYLALDAGDKALFDGFVAYKGASDAFKPLTIDVATDITAGHGGVANTTFVRIGLGSLQIAMESMDANVKVGPTNVGVPNLLYTLGSLYLGNLYTNIDGSSYVDIFTARGAAKQGVSIALAAKINTLTIGEVAWGDSDGLTNNTKINPATGEPIVATNLITADPTTTTAIAGWVGLKNLSIGTIIAKGKADIDVDTAAGTTQVIIGLGTSVANGFSVGMAPMTATAALGNAHGAWAGTFTSGLTQELGEIYLAGLDLTVFGALKIGARASQGVDINLGDLTVTLNGPLTVSWGDKDGLNGTVGTNNGYIGLTGLTITNLALAGKVSIDVASVGVITPGPLPGSKEELMYGAYATHNLSPSFVHIGLGNSTSVGTDTLDNTGAVIGDALRVGMTSLTANVVFAGANTLTGVTAKTLGSLYVGGLAVGMNGWVDIAAH